MAGDTTDADIIKDNPNLEPLAAELEKHSIADLRKIIQSKMKKNNEEIKTIPARIDELNGMMGETPGDREKLEAALKDLEKQRAARQTELLRIQNGGEVAERRKYVAEIQAKMTKCQAEFEAEHTRKAGEAEKVIRGCQSEIERLGQDIERNQKDIERLETTANTADKLAAGLREEWNTIHAEPFPDNISDTCPCCGQKLPAEKLESIRAAELQKFNLNKAERLKAIQEKGKRIMAGKQSDLSAVATLKTTSEEKQARIDELVKKLEENQKLLESTEKTDIKNSPEYITLAEELKMAESFITTLEGSSQEAADTVEVEISNLATEISGLQEQLAAFKKNDEMKARIEELKDREKTLGKLYSDLEKQLFLTEEFLRAKVKATEETINSHFKYVRFKMFTQKINGALEECCEPIIDGVPFNDGLNKGNKMKAALDILNALTKYFGATMPVFIDDCESYTSLPAVDSQLIKLIAVKGEKSLTINVDK
jgi:chromosome segregation ATPase